MCSAERLLMMKLGSRNCTMDLSTWFARSYVLDEVLHALKAYLMLFVRDTDT